MTPNQAAQVIQKAWFEWKSWQIAQSAEYRDTPIPWTPTLYYFDEESECTLF